MPRKKIAVGDYGVNPFVSALVVEVTEMVTGKGDGVKCEYVERNSYAKVFRTVQCREILFMLTPMGKNMFLYLLHRVEQASDMIKITPEMFNEYMGLKSITSYYNGVNDLHKMGVISPVVGHKHTYWINPSIMFVGSRIRKYPDNVVVKTTFKKQ